MSRIQLALNVSNLDEAITFYSKFFDTTPAKVRPGYANFAVGEPPLKLVLIEGGGEPGSINHLGVEVFSSDEVVAATKRLSDEGMATDMEESINLLLRRAGQGVGRGTRRVALGGLHRARRRAARKRSLAATDGAARRVTVRDARWPGLLLSLDENPTSTVAPPAR